MLTNEHALHQKPMSHLFREAARFESCIQLIQGEKTAALCSSREVMWLNMQCGSSVTVTVEGKDEEAAVAAIQNYFVSNL